MRYKSALIYQYLATIGMAGANRDHTNGAVEQGETEVAA